MEAVKKTTTHLEASPCKIQAAVRTYMLAAPPAEPNTHLIVWPKWSINQVERRVKIHGDGVADIADDLAWPLFCMRM